MQVAGDRIIGKCDSCPFVGDLDNKHRLAAFIIKKPPPLRTMANGKVVKVEEKASVATGKGKGKNRNKKEENTVEKVEEKEELQKVEE